MSVNSYLRHRKKSKTFIKKSKKGIANYWLYKKLHNEINLGYIYYFNLLLLVITPLYFVIVVSLGWLDVMALPIAVLNLLLCGIQVPSTVFSHIYDNYETYGQPFILLRRRYNNGYDSSFVIFCCIVIMVVFSIYNFTLAL
jgi:hypothetical protein